MIGMEKDKTVCLILSPDLALKKNAVCEHFKMLSGGTGFTPAISVAAKQDLKSTAFCVGLQGLYKLWDAAYGGQLC